MITETTSEPSGKLDAETISRRAYQLWERAGRPTDRDLEFWLEAEKQLESQTKTVSAAPPTYQVPAAKPALPTPAATARADISRATTLVSETAKAPRVETPAPAASTAAFVSTPRGESARVAQSLPNAAQAARAEITATSRSLPASASIPRPEHPENRGLQASRKRKNLNKS